MGLGANHLQKELDSKPEMLAPAGERCLGRAGLARPRALGMDPEEWVLSTGQDQGSKALGDWPLQFGLFAHTSNTFLGH